MSEMIDIKKTYKTRGGHPVRILATDIGGNRPVVAVIGDTGTPLIPLILLYTSDGCYASWQSDNMYDLIEVKPVREGWVNISAPCPGIATAGHVWATKEEADRVGLSNRFACIKIQFAEGEGLNDNQTGR